MVQLQGRTYWPGSRKCARLPQRKQRYPEQARRRSPQATRIDTASRSNHRPSACTIGPSACTKRTSAFAIRTADGTRDDYAQRSPGNCQGACCTAVGLTHSLTALSSSRHRYRRDENLFLSSRSQRPSHSVTTCIWVSTEP